MCVGGYASPKGLPRSQQDSALDECRHVYPKSGRLSQKTGCVCIYIDTHFYECVLKQTVNIHPGRWHPWVHLCLLKQKSSNVAKAGCTGLSQVSLEHKNSPGNTHRFLDTDKNFQRPRFPASHSVAFLLKLSGLLLTSTVPYHPAQPWLKPPLVAVFSSAPSCLPGRADTLWAWLAPSHGLGSRTELKSRKLQVRWNKTNPSSQTSHGPTKRSAGPNPLWTRCVLHPLVRGC